MYADAAENISYAIRRREVVRPHFALHSNCAVLARLHLNANGRRFSLFPFETASGPIVFEQTTGLARAVLDTMTIPKADALHACTTINSLYVKHTSIQGSSEHFVCCLSHEFYLSTLYFSLHLIGFEWVSREW